MKFLCASNSTWVARLGFWNDDIRSNLASKAAAEKPAFHAGAESRPHAMEFLEYAFLNTGQIEKARATTDEAEATQVTDLDPRYSRYFAAVETRYTFLLAVETQDWLLRPIADRQARIGKGEVELPAREILAEMLSLSGDFAAAYLRQTVLKVMRRLAASGAG